VLLNPWKELLQPRNARELYSQLRNARRAEDFQRVRDEPRSDDTVKGASVEIDGFVVDVGAMGEGGEHLQVGFVG
jgi:hypothetical protein